MSCNSSLGRQLKRRTTNGKNDPNGIIARNVYEYTRAKNQIINKKIESFELKYNALQTPNEKNEEYLERLSPNKQLPPHACDDNIYDRNNTVEIARFGGGGGVSLQIEEENQFPLLRKESCEIVKRATRNEGSTGIRKNRKRSTFGIKKVYGCLSRQWYLEYQKISMYKQLSITQKCKTYMQLIVNC